MTRGRPSTMDGSTTKKSPRKQHIPKSQLPQSSNSSPAAIAKSSAARMTKDEKSSMRQYLLQCPSLSADSEVMLLALAALEEVQDKIIVRSNENKRRNSSSNNKTVSGIPISPPGVRSVLADDSVTTNSFSPMTASTEQQPPSPVSPSEKRGKHKTKVRGGGIVSLGSWAIRCMVVYIPLVTLFTLAVFLSSLHVIQTEYLSPRMKLMTFDEDESKYQGENMYYGRECTADDLSTNDASDLYVDPNSKPKELFDHQMTHGTSIYPNVISDETAIELRDYILKRNEKLTDADSIGVIENENRWSFGIGVNDDPIVTKMLREFAMNKMLRSGLEGVAGRNPAIVELTAISVGPGAKDQFWHQDTLARGNALKYGRSFVPTYNFFIPLQDTTAEMGATEILPGSHMCTQMDEQTFQTHGLQVSGTSVWKRGNAAFINQQIYHRGTAFTDLQAPTRVIFMITFAPRPADRGETRIIGLGGSYSLRRDMWGHTLNDLVEAQVSMAQPWATLRSLGVYKGKDADWGWTYLTQVSARMANSDTAYEDHELESFIEEGGFGLPSILTASEKETWEEYFVEHLKLWKNLAILANLIAVVGYLVGALVLGIIGNAIKLIFMKKHVPNNRFIYSIGSTALRLALIDGTIFLLSIWAMHNLSETHWAREIQTGRLHQPSFDIIKLKEGTPTRSASLVTVNDKLISTNYDSKELVGVGKFLNYHPGNLVFDEGVRYASSLFPVLNSDDKMTVVSALVKEALLTNNRLLLQDHLGDWTILNVADCERYTGRALSLQSNPLAASLENERASMAFYYRNGELKSTVMGKKVGTIYMDSLMDRIFEREIPYISHFKSLDPLQPTPPETQGNLNTKQTHVVKQPLLGLVNPPGLLIYASPILASKPHTSPRRPKFQIVETRTAEPVLKQLDYVEVFFEEPRNWYKAQIHHIKFGYLIGVMYPDGEYEAEITRNIATPFKQYAVGEIIEARLRDGDDDSWQKAKVIKNVNSQTVKLEYGSGFVGKVSHMYVRRFEHHFQVRDEVACEYQNTWLRATIARALPDGTAYVKFEDGFKLRVYPHNLRAWKWFKVHN